MAVMHTVIMAAQFNGPNGYKLTQTSLNALTRPVRSCEVNVMLILFSCKMRELPVAGPASRFDGGLSLPRLGPEIPHDDRPVFE